MLFVEIHYDEVQRKVKDFIKIHDFVTINETDTKLKGYYNVKFIDSKEQILKKIDEIKDKFPFNQFDTKFAYVDADENCEQLISTKKKETLFDEIYKYKWEDTNVGYEDLFDLLKINILMCKKEYSLDYIYYSSYASLSTILGYMYEHEYLIKSQPDVYVHKRNNGKLSIRPFYSLMHMYFQIKVFTVNGYIHLGINFYRIFDFIKLMNLTNRFFKVYDDLTLIDDEKENILALKQPFIASNTKKNVKRFTKILKSVFKENYDLILTYFTYLVRHVHKNEFKILNFICIKSSYIHVLGYLFEDYMKILSWKELDLIRFKHPEDYVNAPNKNILLYIGYEFENIDALLTFDEYIIINKSCEINNNDNVINIKFDINQPSINYREELPFSRALYVILSKYEIKPEILKLLQRN